MKKTVAVFLAVGMLLVAGCGESEKVIEGNVQNAVTGGVQSEETGEVRESPTKDTAAADSRGYVFTFNNTVVEMDADAAPILSALGEPTSYFETTSCAFEGLDKIYTYNGFELDTYPMEDKDYVSSVVLKDDSVTTAEGISIGNSLEELEEAYGSDGAEENGMIVYGKDGMKLCFILQYGEIVSIEYRSTVLDE